MTRRITFLVGATCVVLILVALLGGCGDDERAARERWAHPPEPTRPTTESTPPDRPPDDATDPALCLAASIFVAGLEGGSWDDARLRQAIEVFEQLEPFTDGQMRDDVRLMAAAAREEVAGRGWPAWRGAELQDAGNRFAEAMRQCDELPIEAQG